MWRIDGMVRFLRGLLLRYVKALASSDKNKNKNGAIRRIAVV